MVALSDRLQYVVGANSADPLDEVFGIRTVDDLLRHYPRSYVEGATVRGANDERPQAGQHITLVDTITSAVERPIKNRPKDKLLIVTARLRPLAGSPPRSSTRVSSKRSSPKAPG